MAIGYTFYNDLSNDICIFSFRVLPKFPSAFMSVYTSSGKRKRVGVFRYELSEYFVSVDISEKSFLDFPISILKYKKTTYYNKNRYNKIELSLSPHK